MNWYEAKTYCDNLNLYGSKRWFFPDSIKLIETETKYSPQTESYLTNYSEYFWINQTHLDGTSKSAHVTNGKDSYNTTWNKNKIFKVICFSADSYLD
jgi:hypothetical protein